MFDYDSVRWKRLARMVMRRDGYMCQLSKRYGKAVPAEVVHHIFPVDEFPEYAYEPWNLIALSRKMHNTLHDAGGSRPPRGFIPPSYKGSTSGFDPDRGGSIPSGGAKGRVALARASGKTYAPEFVRAGGKHSTHGPSFYGAPWRNYG